ncbi:T9SS type A sorting domain-containing protein [Bacteroidales bacterium OttesenSCG-928-L19]|nr:T9SS type A sorting domain-containing protein [Bacteroidales bacterium OttesenSCG-928-L19]
MKQLSILKSGGVTLLFLLLSVNLAHSQTEFNITYQDGATATYNIETIGKVYFQDDAMFVMERQDSPVTISIPTIRKITVVGEPVAIENFNLKKESYLLYPNPVQHAFQIKTTSSEEKLTVELYSMSGALLLKKEISAGDAIDVSALASGLYIVKINETTLKMSKL